MSAAWVAAEPPNLTMWLVILAPLVWTAVVLVVCLASPRRLLHVGQRPEPASLEAAEQVPAIGGAR